VDKTSLGFPYHVNDLAQTATSTGDENLRAKIVQIVLTSPGERVNLPDFGCGLRDLVFDPNNEILAATTEFAISKALQQWLSDDIIVESVNVSNSAENPRISEGELQIEVVYLRRDQLVPAKLKITF
jgi:phage baseplate assembly protein W